MRVICGAGVLLLVSVVQVLDAVQPYRFVPAGTVVLKNNWPTWQVAGKAVPTVTGRVKGKVAKSALRL